jgi:hypothetical protein
MEGQSLPPPPPARRSRGHVALGLAVAAPLAAAGAWLAARGGELWSHASGYGPADLAALAYILAGLAVLVAAAVALLVGFAPVPDA